MAQGAVQRIHKTLEGRVSMATVKEALAAVGGDEARAISRLLVKLDEKLEEKVAQIHEVLGTGLSRTEAMELLFKTGGNVDRAIGIGVSDPSEAGTEQMDTAETEDRQEEREDEEKKKEETPDKKEAPRRSKRTPKKPLRYNEDSEEEEKNEDSDSTEDSASSDSSSSTDIIRRPSNFRGLATEAAVKTVFNRPAAPLIPRKRHRKMSIAQIIEEERRRRELEGEDEDEEEENHVVIPINPVYQSRRTKPHQEVKSFNLKKGCPPVAEYEPDRYKVYREDLEVYHAPLFQPGQDTIYYLIQLLESHDGNELVVYSRWGFRAIRNAMKVTTYTKERLSRAKDDFETRFKNKTGNKWIDRASFVGQIGMLHFEYIDWPEREEGEEPKEEGSGKNSQAAGRRNRARKMVELNKDQSLDMAPDWFRENFNVNPDPQELLADPHEWLDLFHWMATPHVYHSIYKAMTGKDHPQYLDDHEFSRKSLEINGLSWQEREKAWDAFDKEEEKKREKREKERDEREKEKEEGKGKGKGKGRGRKKAKGEEEKEEGEKEHEVVFPPSEWEPAPHDWWSKMMKCTEAMSVLEGLQGASGHYDMDYADPRAFDDTAEVIQPAYSVNRRAAERSYFESCRSVCFSLDRQNPFDPPFRVVWKKAEREESRYIYVSSYVSNRKPIKKETIILKVQLHVRTFEDMQAEVRGHVPNQPAVVSLLRDHTYQRLSGHVFNVQSNTRDPEADTPQCFALDLYPQQRRSLWWMLQQESMETPPLVLLTRHSSRLGTSGLYYCHEHNLLASHEFHEEMEVGQRGGVLCDKPGYGKTCVTIALVAATLDTQPPVPKPEDQRMYIGTNATLIVCPSNLHTQWKNEIKKFTGSKLKVLSIRGIEDLKKVNSYDVIAAHVVLVPYNLLTSTQYSQQLNEACSRQYHLDHKKGEMEFQERRRAIREHLRREFEKGSAMLEAPGPLLEYFYWKRIVFDEYHEVAQQALRMRLSIRLLNSAYRWGLTGTPIIKTHAQICKTALYMNIELPNHPYESQRFLDYYVRQNTELPPLPSLTNHHVAVKLTPQERAIYLARSWSGQRGLIAACSHFSPADGEGANTGELKTVDEVSESMVKDQQRQISDYEKRLKMEKRTRERAENDEIKMTKMEMSQTQGRITRFENQLAKLRSTLKFFGNMLEGLKEGQNFTCAICLDNLGPGIERVITKCGHVYCPSCITQAVNQYHTCPICKHELTNNDIIKYVSDVMKEGPDAKEDAFGDAAKYGSKIRAMVQQLSKIRENDPTAKVIVFAQWEDLLAKIGSAFKQCGIRFEHLEGSIFQLNSCLENFTHDPNCNVLTLSLEKRASGMNLVWANHVFVVHPMDCATEEQAMAYETQAIARVMRPGQTKGVHVWRFVTEDTVEAELHAKRQSLQEQIEKEAEERERQAERGREGQAQGAKGGEGASGEAEREEGEEEEEEDGEEESKKGKKRKKIPVPKKWRPRKMARKE